MFQTLGLVASRWTHETRRACLWASLFFQRGIFFGLIFQPFPRWIPSDVTVKIIQCQARLSYVSRQFMPTGQYRHPSKIFNALFAGLKTSSNLPTILQYLELNESKVSWIMYASWQYVEYVCISEIAWESGAHAVGIGFTWPHSCGDGKWGYEANTK